MSRSKVTLAISFLALMACGGKLAGANHREPQAESGDGEGDATSGDGDDAALPEPQPPDVVASDASDAREELPQAPVAVDDCTTGGNVFVVRGSNMDRAKRGFSWNQVSHLPFEIDLQIHIDEPNFWNIYFASQGNGPGLATQEYADAGDMFSDTLPAFSLSGLGAMICSGGAFTITDFRPAPSDAEAGQVASFTAAFSCRSITGCIHVE